MTKHIILNEDKEFLVIIHACPMETGLFQWYTLVDPNECHKKNIKKEIYESITLSSDSIKQKYYRKWLACHCEVNGTSYEEGCVYLTDDFIDMIRENQFDTIDIFDKDGMVKREYINILKK